MEQVNQVKKHVYTAEFARAYPGKFKPGSIVRSRCAYCNSSIFLSAKDFRKRRKACENDFCSRKCRNAKSEAECDARFWAKIDASGGDDACWLWLAGCDGDGYGLFCSWEKKSVRATRHMYKLFYGIDPGAYLVCHKCDNPKCVNPHHLWLGTNVDNQRDMANKNRYGTKPTKPGEDNIKAKLKEYQVLEIYQRVTGGEKLSVLSREYGVSTPVIAGIRDCKIWKRLLITCSVQKKEDHQ